MKFGIADSWFKETLGLPIFIGIAPHVLWRQKVIIVWYCKAYLERGLFNEEEEEDEEETGICNLPQGWIKLVYLVEEFFKAIYHKIESIRFNWYLLDFGINRGIFMSWYRKFVYYSITVVEVNIE